MANPNEPLVVERPSHDDEDTSATVYKDGRKLWIPFGKISWPAIFAGVLVTAVTQMLLSLLGMGIGMGTVDPLEEANPARGLGTGTVIWWSLTMLVSLFVGGYATGKMYQTRSRNYLNWHGFLTWCTFTVLSFFLLTTSIGRLVSGAANVVGGTLQTVAPLAPDISNITREARGLLLPPVGPNRENTFNNSRGTQNGGGTQFRSASFTEDAQDNRPGATRQNDTGLTTRSQTDYNERTNRAQQGNRPGATRQNDVNQNTERGTANDMNYNSQRDNTGYGTMGGDYGQGMFPGGYYGSGYNNMNNMGGRDAYVVEEVQAFFRGDVENREAREALVNTLTRQTGMSRSEADRKIDAWIGSYQNIREEARVKADEAARAVSRASFIGFFALIIGALVTVWGARASTPEKDKEPDFAVKKGRGFATT